MHLGVNMFVLFHNFFWHNFLSTALLPPNFYPEKSGCNVQKILPHLDISVLPLNVSKEYQESNVYFDRQKYRG